MADKRPKLTIEESDAREATDTREATAGQAEPRAAQAEQAEQSEQAEPQPASAGGASDKRENPFRTAASATSGWLADNFPGHEYAVFGGLCGLVVAILVFVIGFWQAIFLAICVTVGVAIGQYVDGNPTVVRFVRRFFGEGN